MLTSEKLLAGASVCFEITIPTAILQADLGDTASLTDNAGQALSAEQMGNLALAANPSAENRVRMRPLTVGDLQLINRAAKDSDSLMASLMVQSSLVEPEMSIAEVNRLPVGILQYLLDQVNEISGINASEDQVRQAAEEPLARAAFILAKNFGWTPQQVGDLTLGQILFNLKLLRQGHEEQD
jgi:hypothetical protein